MKKVLFIFIVLVLNIGSLLFIFEVYPISDLRGKETDILHDYNNLVLIIQKRKDCTPVRLNLYADNNYELSELSECNFELLMNDFKNYGKGRYKYSYTIVNYILNNYSRENILKLIYDSDYLIENAKSIFEEVASNTQIKKTK